MYTQHSNYSSITPRGYTSEANTLVENYDEAMEVHLCNSFFYFMIHEGEEKRKFIKLRNIWKRETKFTSSTTHIISNPSYIDIIRMGLVVIPLIIRDLQETNSHWFYALEKITGKNPIQPKNIGIVENMKNDWVEWAKTNDYV